MRALVFESCENQLECDVKVTVSACRHCVRSRSRKTELMFNKKNKRSRPHRTSGSRRVSRTHTRENTDVRYNTRIITALILNVDHPSRGKGWMRWIGTVYMPLVPEPRSTWSDNLREYRNSNFVYSTIRTFLLLISYK